MSSNFEPKVQSTKHKAQPRNLKFEIQELIRQRCAPTILANWRGEDFPGRFGNHRGVKAKDLRIVTYGRSRTSWWCFY